MALVNVRSEKAEVEFQAWKENVKKQAKEIYPLIDYNQFDMAAYSFAFEGHWLQHNPDIKATAERLVRFARKKISYE